MSLSHLDELESEAIFILREAAALFRSPVLLFSGGKDSAVLTRLAEKAFRPGPFPFPLMLIDTGHNFTETLEYVARRQKALGERLIVERVQETIDEGRALEETAPYASRNRIQSVTLMDAIRKHGFDALIGGARRDEEKARAKERVFSVRNEFGEWDPKAQRPEPWHLYHGRLPPGGHVRVFPLSNWTEIDVWEYVASEILDLPSLYFSHRRHCVRRGESLLAHSDFLRAPPTDPVEELQVRFRTVGDMTCTGATLSAASSVSEILDEIRASRRAERGSRLDDKSSESAMEDRKREGYF